MATATAAVLSANHEPFDLEQIEVDPPRRGEVCPAEGSLCRRLRQRPRKQFSDMALPLPWISRRFRRR